MAIQGFKVDKIDERTFLLAEKKFSSCLIYLLLGETSALLIDTGMGTGDLRAAVSQLTDLPVTVVCTHGHLDHIANNHQFSDIYLCELDRPVYTAHTDPQYVRGLMAINFPDFVVKLLKKPLHNLLFPDRSGNYHYIREGFVFDLGGRTLEVIETPGHTAGSICLLERATRTLYSGDTVCDRGILLNMEYCLDADVFLQSIKKLEARMDEFDTIYAGHHLHPIGTEYLARYHACAAGILDGSLPAEDVKEGTLRYKASQFENIKIAFKNPTV